MGKLLIAFNISMWLFLAVMFLDIFIPSCVDMFYDNYYRYGDVAYDMVQGCFAYEMPFLRFKLIMITIAGLILPIMLLIEGVLWIKRKIRIE